MNDEFLSALLSQYREEIEEILVECEHVYRSTIDYELLDHKIEELLCSASVDGLPEKMVWELITAKIPSYINYMNYKKSASKKAA